MFVFPDSVEAERGNACIALFAPPLLVRAPRPFARVCVRAHVASYRTYATSMSASRAFRLAKDGNRNETGCNRHRLHRAVRPMALFFPFLLSLFFLYFFFFCKSRPVVSVRGESERAKWPYESHPYEAAVRHAVKRAGSTLPLSLYCRLCNTDGINCP